MSATERRLSETVIRSELALLSLSGDRELAKRLKRLYAAGGFGGSVVFAMMRTFVNIRKTAREKRYREMLTLMRGLFAVGSEGGRPADRQEPRLTAAAAACLVSCGVD